MTPRDSYPLAALIRLRNRALDQAERDLAAALAAEHQAGAALESVRRKLELTHLQVTHYQTAIYETSPPTTLDIATVIRRHQELEALATRARRLEATVADRHRQWTAAQAAVVTAREALTAAMIRRNVVRQHHQAWLTARRRARHRREEAAAVELSTHRYIRKTLAKDGDSE